MDLLKSGQKVDPLMIGRCGGHISLEDGHHRLKAARYLIEKGEIEEYVFELIDLSEDKVPLPNTPELKRIRRRSEKISIS
jgi:hypothetical protein